MNKKILKMKKEQKPSDLVSRDGQVAMITHFNVHMYMCVCVCVCVCVHNNKIRIMHSLPIKGQGNAGRSQ